MPNNQPQEKFSQVTEDVQVIKAKKKLAELKGEELVSFAEAIGRQLSPKGVGLKTNQIRKFLDAVNNIRNRGIGNNNIDYRTEAMMLKPKLAYASGRAEDSKRPNAVKPMFDVISPCIDKVFDRDDFNQLAIFIEAIVAYHKYNNGQD